VVPGTVDLRAKVEQEREPSDKPQPDCRAPGQASRPFRSVASKALKSVISIRPVPFGTPELLGVVQAVSKLVLRFLFPIPVAVIDPH
ncbi:MAG: hypothetical protein Q7T65_06285, partial [Thiobacillus sp.]|nr:hypothetical protein [Thiobacillus sp.]